MKKLSLPLLTVYQVIEIILMTLAALIVPFIIYLVGFSSEDLQSFMAIILISAIYLEIVIFYISLKKI